MPFRPGPRWGYEITAFPEDPRSKTITYVTRGDTFEFAHSPTKCTKKEGISA